MKATTKKQYDEMVKQASPKSPVFKDCALAFLFGGTVCTIGQVLCDLYVNMGYSLKDARAAVSVTLVFIAAVMTMFNIYSKVAKYAGAGLVVPITGFSNSMVSAAMDFRSEGFVMGVGAKIFTVAGPVIVYGISASVLYGIILYAVQRIGGIA